MTQPTQEQEQQIHPSLQLYSFTLPSLTARTIGRLELAIEHLDEAIRQCKEAGDDGTYLEPLQEIRNTLDRQIQALDEVGR